MPSVNFEQVVYGKRVQFPGGPIVPLDGYHHTGRSAGVEPKLLELCTPKNLGIEFRSGNWRDYPWREQQLGAAMHLRECGDQWWVIAVRACGLSEAGTGAPATAAARFYDHAQYLLTPASKWHPEVLDSLLNEKLKIEPMTEDRTDLPPVEIPLAPDSLPLREGWFERVAPFLKVLASGESVTIEARVLPPDFLETVRVCLASLPDAVSCRMPVGVALGVGGPEFAISHGLGARTTIKLVEKSGGPEWRGLEERDLNGGRLYVEWLAHRAGGATSAGELHQLVQDGWPKYADHAAFPLSISWQTVAKRVTAHLQEALWAATLPRVLASGEAIKPMPEIVERRFDILEVLLNQWERPASQALIPATLGWADEWRKVLGRNGLPPEVKALGAFADYAPLRPIDVSWLGKHQLVPQLVEVLTPVFTRALSTATDADAWIRLIKEGALDGWLATAARAHPEVWVDLVCRGGASPKLIPRRLFALRDFGLLDELMTVDRLPNWDTAWSLAVAIGRLGPAAIPVAKTVVNRLRKHGSALGAAFLISALKEHQIPPSELSPVGLPKAIAADIEERNKTGQKFNLKAHPFIAEMLLNHTEESQWSPSVKGELARVLGLSAIAVVGVPALPGVQETGLEIIRNCVRTMPPEKHSFWARILAEMLRQFPNKSGEITELVDYLLDRIEVDSLASSPILHWHAFHTGRTAKPASSALLAESDSARSLLMVLLRDSDRVTPGEVPESSASEGELFFAAARAWRTQKPCQWPTAYFSNIIAALSKLNPGKQHSGWVKLIEDARLTESPRWRVLWRVLRQQHFSGGRAFPTKLSYEDNEVELIRSLPADAILYLVLASYRVPIHVLDELDLFADPDLRLSHDGMQPIPLSVKRLSAGDNPRSREKADTRTVKLTLADLFTIAEAARDYRCKKFLGTLSTLAVRLEAGSGKTKSSRLFRGQTFKKLAEMCRRSA